MLRIFSGFTGKSNRFCYLGIHKVSMIPSPSSIHEPGGFEIADKFPNLSRHLYSNSDVVFLCQSAQGIAGSFGENLLPVHNTSFTASCNPGNNALSTASPEENLRANSSLSSRRAYVSMVSVSGSTIQYS